MFTSPLRRRSPRLSRAVAALAFALLVGSLTAGGAWGAPAARHAGGAASFVPHEVIVGYAPRARITEALRTGAGAGARAAAAPASPGTRAELLHLPPRASVKAAVARLRRQPGVTYAEPNYVAHAAGLWYPNDPGLSRRAQGWQRMQWNLLPGTGVNAPQAWWNLFGDHRGGGRGVKIAILDTGIAYRNWRGFLQSPDFRGTRFVSPRDLVANNSLPLDRNGHGTFVAGLVSEATNNGYGLTGLAYAASIMPVRVLDSGGLGDEVTIARGIRYAVTHGAQVINLSLEFLPTQVASGSAIPQIVSALNFAHRRGVTVVGAAGNDEDSQIAYPARVKSVISVGATTSDGCLADYSNGGAGLDLVAPGGGSDAIIPRDPHCHPDRDLPSINQLTLTDPPHWATFGYPGFYIGTSMASPEVAATAALVIASRVIGRHPSPDQILDHLEQTATTLGTTKPNDDYGYGLVNAGLATSKPAIAAR